jgi:hypothetical protein
MVDEYQKSTQPGPAVASLGGYAAACGKSYLDAATAL